MNNSSSSWGYQYMHGNDEWFSCINCNRDILIFPCYKNSYTRKGNTYKTVVSKCLYSYLCVDWTWHWKSDSTHPPNPSTLCQQILKFSSINNNNIKVNNLKIKIKIIINNSKNLIDTVKYLDIREITLKINLIRRKCLIINKKFNSP